jgi:hypothetical protein
MTDEGQEEQQEQEPEEEQGSAVRRFLRRVGASIGSVASNPMTTLWDSARRDERRKRQRDY